MGNLGSVSEFGISPEEGKGYPLQYSGLENSMDCIVHGGHKESDKTERLSLFFHFILILLDFLCLYLLNLATLLTVYCSLIPMVSRLFLT